MIYDQLKLQNQLCFKLYTSSRLITQTYYPFLENLGITYPQYLVLMVLWEEDNQKVMELAHRLYLDSNTMTPLIQRMAQLGLVNRVKGEIDGRETYVSDRLFENEEEFERFKAISVELDNLISHVAGQRAKEKEATITKMREEKAAKKAKKVRK